MIYLDKDSTHSYVMAIASALSLSSNEIFRLKLISTQTGDEHILNLGTNLSTNKNRYDRWELPLESYNSLVNGFYQGMIINQDDKIFDLSLCKVDSKELNQDSFYDNKNEIKFYQQ